MEFYNISSELTWSDLVRNKTSSILMSRRFSTKRFVATCTWHLHFISLLSSLKEDEGELEEDEREFVVDVRLIS